jgi:hypothetical protein
MGKGANKGGWHTSKGKYMIDLDKVLSLQVPDLADCNLRPYISCEGESLDVSKTMMNKTE